MRSVFPNPTGRNKGQRTIALRVLPAVDVSMRTSGSSTPGDGQALAFEVSPISHPFFIAVKQRRIRVARSLANCALPETASTSSGLLEFARCPTQFRPRYQHGA